MNRVYSVIIKGRTLESRDVRELLARAVARKRETDRKFMLQNLSRGKSSVVAGSGSLAAAGNGTFA
jgi:hypothetical protein